MKRLTLILAMMLVLSGCSITFNGDMKMDNNVSAQVDGKLEVDNTVDIDGDIDVDSNVVVGSEDDLDLNGNDTEENLPSDSQPSAPVTQPTDDTERIACTSIKLGVKLHEFKAENETLVLAVEKTPANTTDAVTFESSDPTVAVVDGSGNVTPGTVQGEAVITVKCGDAKAECRIVSTVGEEPVVDTPDIPAVTLPDGFVLKLNRKDFNISAEGYVWNLLSGIDLMGVAPSDITWSSDKPEVATVADGKVTGVNRGMCTVTATIGDQTATCIVRCSFDAAPVSDYKLSHVDVTIAVGETFNLSLKSKETGANVQGIEWQVTQEGIVSVSGNKITGQTVCWSGMEVFVEYEGVRYACRIIVKPAEF